MNEQTRFSFYNCRYNHYIGIPTIIITCTAKPTTKRYIAEYFIMAPKTKYFYAQSIAAPEYKLLDLNIDFEFMVNQAIKSAEERLNFYISELYIKNKDNEIFPYPELKKDSPINFMKIVRTRELRENVITIRNSSKCIPLTEFIDKIIDEDETFDITMKEIK